MTILIDRKAAAASAIFAATKLESSRHRMPSLAVVIVGGAPTGRAYAGAKNCLTKQYMVNKL